MPMLTVAGTIASPVATGKRQNSARIDFGKRFGFRLVRNDCKGREFFASHAAEDVVRHELARCPGESGKNGIARLVAEAVVDAFEMIEVEEQHGDLALGVKGLLLQCVELGEEAAAVPDAGQ